jgi:hypothetical protein
MTPSIQRTALSHLICREKASYQRIPSRISSLKHLKSMRIAQLIFRVIRFTHQQGQRILKREVVPLIQKVQEKEQLILKYRYQATIRKAPRKEKLKRKPKSLS